MIAQPDFQPIEKHESADFHARNVLTNSHPGDPPKASNDQRLSGDGDDAGGAGLTSRVKQSAQSHRSKAKRSGRRRAPRKRGPQPTKYLTTDEVREIDQAIHTLRSAGKPLNRMVTINAPQGVPDAQGKRLISRELAHIGQDLKRAGHDHIDVYEKHGASGRVHVHSLVHTPRGFEHLIEKHDEGDCGDVCVSRADHRAAAYVTKQRRRGSPDYERANKRPWRPCAEIPGKRFSISPAARAIIKAADQAKARTPAHDPIERRLAAAAAPPPVIEMVAKPVQLRLFDQLPEARDPEAPSQARAMREALGETQAGFYRGFAIKQPHAANFERGHDPLAKPKLRALKYQIHMMTRAAA